MEKCKLILALSETVKVISRTLGDNLWVAWPGSGLQMLQIDLRVHFHHKVLSAKVFTRSQHNFTCSTRSVQTAELPASHAGTHCNKGPTFRLFEISRSYDQSLERVSRSRWSRWQGSDWTLRRSWLVILRRLHSRSATETRTSCRQD